VKSYVGQVFEELDTEQADIFRAVDAEVVAKEDVLRSLCFFPSSSSIPSHQLIDIQRIEGRNNDREEDAGESSERHEERSTDISIRCSSFTK
jgi:hypothetical protein